MRKALTHLRNADPSMAAIIDNIGPYRMTYGAPTFHALARSIVYQQLSGKAAGTIFGRVTGAAGDPLTPEALLRLSPEELRALGLSGQKASYVRDLAERSASGEIEFAKLPYLRDEAVIERLTRVKGVGVWTAHMFLMFAMRRPDVLPTGDLAIRNAIAKVYEFEATPTVAEMEAVAECWRPYRSIASWYLWRSLDVVVP
jgi:DNA-3-methyladenine glycosylase II